MQRRSSKARPLKRKRRPKANADLHEQLGRRTRERDEALEQLTATSEVLQVISRSAFDLGSVLQTLVELAARLCKADKAGITRQVGREFLMRTATKFRASSYQRRLVPALVLVSLTPHVSKRILTTWKTITARACSSCTAFDQDDVYLRANIPAEKL
jgi:hypothetical protein